MTVPANLEGAMDNDPVSRLFCYWQEIMRYRRARLDDKRRRAVQARMREGYTEDDLRVAIEGCYLSPFHHWRENERGQVYDDLTLICRDASHVDKFIAIAEDTENRVQRIKETRAPQPTAEVYDYEAAKVRLAETLKAVPLKVRRA